MWDLFNESGAVANFHIGAGARREEMEALRGSHGVEAIRHRGGRRPIPPVRRPDLALVRAPAHASPSTATQMYMSNVRIIVNLCMSDLFDRYPKLKVVSAESGIGWVPFILEALEYQLDEMVTDPDEIGLQQRRPTEYFRDHIYVMFWFEQLRPGEADRGHRRRQRPGRDRRPAPHLPVPGRPEHFADVLGGLDRTSGGGSCRTTPPSCTSSTSASRAMARRATATSDSAQRGRSAASPPPRAAVMPTSTPTSVRSIRGSRLGRRFHLRRRVGRGRTALPGPAARRDGRPGVHRQAGSAATTSTARSRTASTPAAFTKRCSCWWCTSAGRRRCRRWSSGRKSSVRRGAAASSSTSRCSEHPAMTVEAVDVLPRSPTSRVRRSAPSSDGARRSAPTARRRALRPQRRGRLSRRRPVERAVLRIGAPGRPAEGRHDIARQARILQALDGQPGVRTPELFWSSPSLPGDGRAPSSPATRRTGPPRRRRPVPP